MTIEELKTAVAESHHPGLMADVVEIIEQLNARVAALESKQPDDEPGS